MIDYFRNENKKYLNLGMAERNITRLLAARHKSKDFSTLNTESIRKSVESATGTMDNGSR